MSWTGWRRLSRYLHRDARRRVGPHVHSVTVQCRPMVVRPGATVPISFAPSSLDWAQSYRSRGESCRVADGRDALRGEVFVPALAAWPAAQPQPASASMLQFGAIPDT